MNKNTTQTEELKFSDTDGSEKAVLGVLEGPCADFIDATRNGRSYSETLWKKVFNDPIVLEMFENGGIPGELDHPAEREEVDSSRIAILMKEKPVEKNGKLWAKFNIVNTPLGKIAYALAKAGFKFGISSRGSGDTFINSEGGEQVDEDSYDFKCFDLVLLPAVKVARMNLVKESLQTKNNLRQTLKEAMNTATDKEKSLMTETLKNLHIDYPVQEVNIADIKNTRSNTLAVDNVEANVVKDLQEALQKVKKLEAASRILQEKLSVSYTEGAKWGDEREKLKSAIKHLTEANCKAVAMQKTSCIDKANVQKTLERKDEEISQLKEKLNSLTETLDREHQASHSLREGLSNKDNKISSYKDEVQRLNEELSNTRTAYEEKLNNQMLESASAKKDSKTKFDVLQERFIKSNSLIEKYKGIAKTAVNRYISLQAVRIGVSEAEIQNRLNETYTFEDVDRICEDLQRYKLNLNKLPFKVDTNKVKVKVTESTEPIKPACGLDDTIDDQLIYLAGK